MSNKKQQAPKFKKRNQRQTTHAGGITIAETVKNNAPLIPVGFSNPDMQVIEQSSLIKFDIISIGYPIKEVNINEE